MAGQTIVEINDDINLAVSVDQVAPGNKYMQRRLLRIFRRRGHCGHYMDQCCVHYGKPLIDSGIMGRAQKEACRDPKFLPRALEALQLKEKVALVREIKDTLVDDRASVFDDCVSFARLRFQEQYDDQIRQLLRVHPAM
ncbi:hypothetical protein MRX96_053775, partial [Rhipicephalus microplus]